MNSKSVEELLAILETSEDQVERLPSEIELFIKDLELIPSDERIRGSHVYWAYLKWKEEGNGEKDILTRDVFFKAFKKHFKAGRVGKFRYYLVSGDKVRFGRREELEVKTDLKREKRWRQRKRKKGI